VALSKKNILAALIFMIGVAVFVVLKVTRPQPTPTEVQERVWRVEVQAAEPTTLSPTLILYGQVETPSLLNAAAPSDAVVEQVYVKEGQVVQKGQLLIELDERDFLPQLDQASADVAELEAELLSERNRHQSNLDSLRHEQALLLLTNAEVNRAEKLQKQNLGSDSALDGARQAAARQALAVTTRQYNIRDHEARLGQLEARLQRARARLTEVELSYKRSRVVAPFDGIAAQVLVAPGDQVRESGVLLKMYATESLEVRARIPAPYQEELQQALHKGEPVVGSVDLSGISVRLRLDRISGEADPSGVDGLFRIETGTDMLRMGQVGKFQLKRPAKVNAVAVPYQALYGDNRIYVLEDGCMRGLNVKVLGQYLSDDGTEQLLVRSAALSKGDLIVVTHLPNAVSGLRVEIVQ
jgi:HlyD family secretion protein